MRLVFRFSRSHSRCAAFTLIEVLIVVMIMGIIASIIMPQMMSSALDSRDAALAHNLHILRNQIDLFKTQHNDNPPGLNGGTPETQLMQYTNANGDTSATPDANHPLGPYFAERSLTNPFNHASHWKLSADPANETPDQALADAGEVVGWFYNPASGQIAANAEGNGSDGTARVKQ
ncbi:MAG TPA: type II secretion system protein [Pirellulales bacterium]|nr:type II secretion system protein [Pirellulales bacterium]